MLQIDSNGSKWYGQQPDTIDDLLQVLKEYPLDETFEGYGNFITEITPEYMAEQNRHGFMKGKDYLIGCTRFFGNFATLSHVFNITTDEPESVKALTEAIRVNQQRPDYRSQKKR